jgi:predicted NAD/FAD-binding protein
VRIAVIGSGIAGLGAAYLLSRCHDVTLFERAPELGGHVRTHEVDVGGETLAIDTGFIVHNAANYPHLVRLFGELGVETQDSEMSFAVSAPTRGVEYCGTRLMRQPHNLRNPSFLALLSEIARFLRAGPSYLDGRLAGLSLGEMVTQEGYSVRFRDLYLVPLTAAIWSSPPGRALEFPAEAALAFFANHGLLGFRRHQWRTVTGGAATYVCAIAAQLPSAPRTGTPVLGIRRTDAGVDVRLPDRESATFDAAVVTTHGDEALALLDDPSDDERRILGTFETLRNEAVLHTDERMLPRRRNVRAAWNYLLPHDAEAAPPTVTYSANRLQKLDVAREYCVTLNRGDIDPDKIIWRTSYRHPQYTAETFGAQRRLPRINGARRTWFCGAWTGWGFHEDGLRSAVQAARELGVRW